MFDVARNLLVVDIDQARVHNRESVRLDTEDLQARAERVAEAGVEVLICGAVSWPLELALAHAGVEVISQTCGDIEQVLAAYAAGRLNQNAFLMPGCCGRRRRFRRQHKGGQQKNPKRASQ